MGSVIDLDNVNNPLSPQIYHKQNRDPKCELHLWVEFVKTSSHSRHLIIYCPFLLINETGLSLSYKEPGLTTSVLTDVRLAQPKFTQNKTSITNSFKKESLRHGGLAQPSTMKGGYLGLIERDKHNSDEFHKIHMFATLKKMKQLKVSLNKAKWSDPFSLQNSDNSLTLSESRKDRVISKSRNVGEYIEKLGDMLQNKKKEQQRRKKYEFAIKTMMASGVFSRSKLIVITPRFAIKNESDQSFLLAQAETEQFDENMTKLKPNSWEYFHWTNFHKPLITILSLTDPLTWKPCHWSGRFKIDQVGESAVKLKKSDGIKSKLDVTYLARVIITLDSSMFIIRILSEDPKNPPYCVENRTSYEIKYRQKLPDDIRSKHAGLNDENSFSRIKPNHKLPYAWDECSYTKRTLEVMIENSKEDYLLDSIGEGTPLKLSQQSDVVAENKDILKKGFLSRKNLYDDDQDYVKEYCMLNVPKQKLKLYNKKANEKQTIILKGARIDFAKDKEFILVCEDTKFNFYQFTGIL